jgi:hypothetical protein
MLQDERHTTAMLRFAGLKPHERARYLKGARVKEDGGAGITDYSGTNAASRQAWCGLTKR